MLTITLPDGNTKQFNEALTMAAIAESIGSGLAKSAIAAEVDGHLVDLSHCIERDAKIKIITNKDPQALDIVRHSTAHLLAHAVKELFPTAQISIGPVIEDGFYYDFAFERSFTPEDLEQIEAKMHQLAKQNFTISRHKITRGEAIQLFSEQQQHYKVQIIEDLPEDELLTIYRQDSFVDLCRGPHVPRTSLLGAFKLTKLAGAYWRGDSNNEMLQRIYGTAWLTQQDLQDYLDKLAEAEKRDHRKLAKKMDLFHVQPEAPGMVFWHPNGWAIVRVIREYLRKKLLKYGYLEVNSPQLVDIELWKKSGHFEKFDDDIFSCESEARIYAIKPMNCPCHVQIFNQGLKSYRDLPIRYAEFGSCHRNEPSGTLHGIMRVRGFVQDDAHIFCTPEQIQVEVRAFITQLHDVYKDFGYTQIIHKLSTRPEKRIGSDETWDIAEKALADALDASGIQWEELPNEGAFYGPKIEFSLHDCLGRVWQCGTMQVDFFTAGRLGAQYIAEDGSKQTPVMLHRAILGSMERFIAILLEHYAEQLPLWLSPVQVVIMNITDRQSEYVQSIAEQLREAGFRVNLDLRNEKIGFKIREHTIARVPYVIVVGDQEVENQQIAVRSLNGENKSWDLQKFIQYLHDEVSQFSKGG